MVVVLHVAFLLAPPLLSNDIFNYIDVARLGGRYHLDPYVATPSVRRHDAVYVWVHWRHAVTDYGPLFTLAVRPLGRVSVAEAMWAFKAIAALAGLGCTALVGWIAHRRGSSPARAVAAFGLNPVLLVWTVGGAHNDLLMLLVMLAGAALVVAQRPALGGAALVGAAAIKLSAGLAIPFYLVRRAPGRLRLLAGIVTAAAVVLAVSYAAFPDHAAGMITKLQTQGTLVDIGSVPLGIAYTLGFIRPVPREMQVLHILLAVWSAGWLVYVARGGEVLAAVGWVLFGRDRRVELAAALVPRLAARVRRRRGPQAASAGHLRGRRLLRDRARATGMTMASLCRRRAPSSCFQPSACACDGGVLGRSCHAAGRVRPRQGTRVT